MKLFKYAPQGHGVCIEKQEVYFARIATLNRMTTMITINLAFVNKALAVILMSRPKTIAKENLKSTGVHDGMGVEGWFGVVKMV